MLHKKNIELTPRLICKEDTFAFQIKHEVDATSIYRPGLAEICELKLLVEVQYKKKKKKKTISKEKQISPGKEEVM